MLSSPLRSGTASISIKTEDDKNGPTNFQDKGLRLGIMSAGGESLAVFDGLNSVSRRNSTNEMSYFAQSVMQSGELVTLEAIMKSNCGMVADVRCMPDPCKVTGGRVLLVWPSLNVELEIPAQQASRRVVLIPGVSEAIRRAANRQP